MNERKRGRKRKNERKIKKTGSKREVKKGHESLFYQQISLD
jgi:hypothetical protein